MDIMFEKLKAIRSGGRWGGTHKWTKESKARRAKNRELEKEIADFYKPKKT